MPFRRTTSLVRQVIAGINDHVSLGWLVLAALHLLPAR
jgi:hypothetical protein